MVLQWTPDKCETTKTNLLSFLGGNFKDDHQGKVTYKLINCPLVFYFLQSKYLKCEY